VAHDQINLKLHDLLEATSEAAIVVDRSGRIITANEIAEGLFGYDATDLLDQPVELLIPDRFHDRHVEHRHNYIAEPRTRPMADRLDLAGRFHRARR
jgi:protein-histidine pros-kinase